MGARDRQRLRLLGLAALLPLLETGVARADPLDVRGFGVFMGYAWGKEAGFEWGFESIGTHHFTQVPACSSEPRSGFGPVLRVAMVGVTRLAVTAALHAGAESTRSVLDFDGELGGTLAFGQRGLQGGVHTGLMFETLVFNTYAHQSWLMSSYSMGGGIRYLPTFGEPGSCAAGRPFRDGTGLARPAALLEVASAASRSSEARLWARRAASESASVPAFLQLAHELLELDAPAQLAERALDAAEEELGHAWAASALASRYSGSLLSTRAPRFQPRAPLPRPQALRRLARESWLDGYLNEGLAARMADAEARELSDDQEAAVCRRIAREEAGHAALALDILRWLRQEAPKLAWSRLPQTTQAPAATADTRLPQPAQQALARDHEQDWRSRFVQLLDGG
jgi:hypothetical protein